MPHGGGFVPDVPEVSVKKLSPSGLFARENPCAGEIFIRHSGTAAQRHGGGGKGYVKRVVKVYFGDRGTVVVLDRKYNRESGCSVPFGKSNRCLMGRMG